MTLNRIFWKKNSSIAALILLFFALDILSVFYNVKFYTYLFESNHVLQYFYAPRILAGIAATYILLCLLLFFLFSFVNNCLSFAKNDSTIFSALLSLNVIFFLFAKNPQIYRAHFETDFVYNYLPLPHGIILYVFSALALLLFSVWRYSRSKKSFARSLALILVLLWTAERSHALLGNDRLFAKAYQQVAGAESIIVVSMDSLNSESIKIIEQFANNSLKKYLTHSTNYTNIIADSTQTHGSLASLFSGKPQSELHPRHPLSEAFSEKGQQKLATLAELKKLNFQTTFIRDEFDTTRFESGPMINNIDFSFKNYPLHPVINRLFFSINALGLSPRFIAERVFPWIFNTSIQSFGFQPSRFATHVSDAISTTLYENSGSNPQFFFIHSCILHQPLNLPFPYYPKRAAPADGGPALSYSDLTHVASPQYSYKNFAERADFDTTLYNSGVKYLTEKYLNPLFENLDQMGALDQSHIILMADHGENTWGKRTFIPQRLNYVFHGDTDLFGSLAQTPLFLVNRPKPVTAPELTDSALLNLSQVLRKELNLPYSNSVYSENAFSMTSEPDDMFSSYTFRDLFTHLRFRGRYAYVDTEFAKPTTLFKQKTVFMDNLKLTLYRTTHGRFLSLCDYKKDLECSTNLWNNPTFRSARLIENLNAAIVSDQKLGLDVPVPLLSNLEIDHHTDLKNHLLNSNFWLNFYGAVVAAIRNGNNSYFEQLLSDREKASRSLLEESVFQKVVQKHCNYFIESNKIFSGFKNCEKIPNSSFENLRDLNQLPKEIYSFALNGILESHQASSSTADLQNVLYNLPLEARQKLTKKLFSVLDAVFHYAIELNFKITESKYWRLKYLIGETISVQNDVLAEFLARTALEPQERSLEQLFANLMNSPNFQFSKKICADVRKIVLNRTRSRTPEKLIVWNSLRKKNCENLRP